MGWSDMGIIGPSRAVISKRVFGALSESYQGCRMAFMSTSTLVEAIAHVVSSMTGENIEDDDDTYYTNIHKLFLIENGTAINTGTGPSIDQQGEIYAASSATKDELAKSGIQADGRFKDGSKPVEVPRRGWRPGEKSIYVEPEVEIDPSEDLDFLFEPLGKTVLKQKSELPPRDDVIMYEEAKHAEVFNKRIQWEDCPNEHRPVIEHIVKQYWDVFDPEGALRHIRGYQFSIDTGNHKPTCVKTPRYGPHESRIMLKLIGVLEDKGVIEHDEGPYGAMIVLAAKPNQEHVHWSQYIFRLCVSYRKLNAITRPFAFPIPRCEDALQKVGSAEYCITGDYDAGYWQTMMHKGSKEKTGFFGPDCKRHWNQLPMGIKNAAFYFVCMVLNMEVSWKAFYHNPETGLALIREVLRLYSQLSPNAEGIQVDAVVLYKNGGAGSAIIIDDVMLFAKNVIALLAYFISMLMTLQHHRVAINLKKTRFLPTRAEFLGVDVMKNGNSPAKSKYGALLKLERPKLFTDLRMLIGLFGFYSKWLPYYEQRIVPWRGYIKQKPPVTAPKEEEAAKLRELWRDREDDQLMKELINEIISGPVLKRADFDRTFYLKTDWSSKGMAMVLCQAECTPEAEEAMMRELKTGVCEFDKSYSGLRLRPVEFYSCLCRGKEQDYHSAAGEFATGRKGMLKFRPYLWYRTFVWLTDCSGILKFDDMDFLPKHQMQRWIMDVLRFDFVLAHRPERMMFECNLLTRYNLFADEHRRADAEKNQEKTDSSNTPAKIPAIIPKEEAFKHANLFAASPDSLAEQLPLPAPTIFQFQTWVKAHSREPSRSAVRPKVLGDSLSRTFLAEICDDNRAVLYISSTGTSLMSEALETMNLDWNMVTNVACSYEWVVDRNIISPEKFLQKLRNPNDTTRFDWIWVEYNAVSVWMMNDHIKDIIKILKARGTRMVTFLFRDTSTLGLMEINTWKDWVQNTIGWRYAIARVQNTYCGGPIERDTQLLVAGYADFIQGIDSTYSPLGEPLKGSFETKEGGDSMREFLDPSNTTFSDYVSGVLNNTIGEEELFDNPHFSRIAAEVTKAGTEISIKIMDVNFPAPDLRDSAKCDEGVFYIETADGGMRSAVRPIRRHEVMRMLGFRHDPMMELIGEMSKEAMMDLCKNVVPVHSLIRIVGVVQMAERRAHELRMAEMAEAAADKNGQMACYASPLPSPQKKNVLRPVETAGDPESPTKGLGYVFMQHIHKEKMEEASDEELKERYNCATTAVINRWTKLPLPTDIEWKQNLQEDQDTRYLIDKIKADALVVYTELRDRRYFLEWKADRLEVEDDILYQWEQPKKRQIRQLRRRVVPNKLRQLICTAYHATPLSGHVGMYKTYYQIVVRYFWPGMYKDIREAVLQCGHCVLGNNVSHKSQQMLGSLNMSEEPFDVLAIDLWIPGATDKPSKDRMMSKVRQSNTSWTKRAMITGLCNLTGFALTAYLHTVTSKTIASVVMTQFFIPHGLPKTVIIDEDSLFKTELVNIMETMGVRYIVVPPEQHEGNLCERFHRYLNKVERIGGLDHKDFSLWMMSAAFAAYAWNAGPVDGTDIARSFAAKARTFRFPLELQEGEQEEVNINQRGEKSVRHIETMFPLWYKQKEVLRILVQERRDHHRKLSNQRKTRRVFNVGDLVIVRRQVHSSAAKGKPGKLMVKPKGPYRVVEKVGTDSYKIQRIPTTQSMATRTAKIQTETAGRMERIPSSIVIHKRVDTMDTKWVESYKKMKDYPLEENLGFLDFGKYRAAAPTEEHGYEKVKTLMDIELELEDEDDEDWESDEEEEKEPSPKRVKTRSNSKEPLRDTQVTERTDLSVEERAKELYQNIVKSKDKLFIVTRPQENYSKLAWHVAQVDMEETSLQAAKRTGKYHVRYWIRNLQDSKKQLVRSCRYWPCINEFKKDGESLGPLVPIKPAKAEETLKKKKHIYFWYQDTIDLLESMVVGPFNFDTSYKIPTYAWETLLRRADEMGIRVQNVDRVVPLDEDDVDDLDDNGNPCASFMHTYWQIDWETY